MTVRSWLAAAVTLHAAVLIQAADPPKKEAAVPAAKKVESTAKVTVRDVNLYVMSAYGNSLNNGVLFRSTMPGFMGMRRLTAERKHLNQPSPAGLITFEGEPNSDIDVLLEFKSGKFFGNWPPCPQKSKRLLWVKAKVEKEPAEVVPALPENHWMSFLRKSDRLWFEGGRRSERFIAYDAELPLPTPVKVTLVEGGHGLANTSKFPLHDVAVYKPEGGQWRVGSLARLDAAPKKEEKSAAKEGKEQTKDKKAPSVEAIFEDKAAKGGPQGEKKTEEKKADDKKVDAKNPDEKPAEANADPTPAPAAAAVAAAPVAAQATPVPAGQPMPAAGDKPAEPKKDDTKVVDVPSSKSPQTKDAITAAWATRLKELGLGEVEAGYLCRQFAEQALRTDSATVVFRLDDELLEELLPLEVTPAPEKQIRVALVVLLDSDPDVAKRVEELVKKLGDPNYTEREKAMEALKKLGPAAKQKVQEAVNDKDAEIAFRAEQLVELINDPTAGQVQPNPGL